MAKFNAKELGSRIDPLPPLAWTALAAASAERVNPVYEKYWVGDHVAEVKEAIDFGWECCAGTPPDPARLKHLEDFVRDHVEFLNEEGITILASSATVSLRILETLRPDRDEAKRGAVRAFGSSVYVVQMAAELSGTMDEQVAEDEELVWQEQAIQLVSQNAGPYDSAMFRALGVTPPLWWDAYVAGAEHLV